MKKVTLMSMLLKRARQAQEGRRRRSDRLSEIFNGSGVFGRPPARPVAAPTITDALPPSDLFWTRIHRHTVTPVKWLVYVPAGTVLKQKDRSPQEWTVLTKPFLAMTAEQASSGQKEVVIFSFNHERYPMTARTFEVSKTEVLWRREGFIEAR